LKSVGELPLRLAKIWQAFYCFGQKCHRISPREPVWLSAFWRLEQGLPADKDGQITIMGASSMGLVASFGSACCTVPQRYQDRRSGVIEEMGLK
jgi:hypothetical protein